MAYCLCDDKTLSNSGSGDHGENTLFSATDLFLLYKQLILQTLQLTRGPGFVGLVRLLRRYLIEYNDRVLLAQIPGLPAGCRSSTGTEGAPLTTSGSGASTGIGSGATAASADGATSTTQLSSSSSVTTTGATCGGCVTTATTTSLGVTSNPFSLANLATLGLSRDSNSESNLLSAVGSLAPNQFFSTFLQGEQQTARLTKDEEYKVCVILVTSSYCLKTAEDLEKRLKAEVRPDTLANEITFSSEIDALASCRSACVHRLVAGLQAGIQPQLVAMTKVSWNSLNQVGDQSAYVTQIIAHLRSHIPFFRDILFSVRVHFTQICTKFAHALISRFVVSLYRCKPVNTFGAEQLLLDTQCLKAALLQLPAIGVKVIPDYACLTYSNSPF
ncbi:unnamed protein product [Protopolystoma xenopodis]|uniref:Vacuolar protein sorting-associated protein 54 C-terminal domain-containing protein n=1 Tax=Protopolystoma xenopodis TaxID=117903 RepID=A0A3S5FBY0_9PLAT|nr:unnamed protein product [Protopolystoma xenopodis]